MIVHFSLSDLTTICGIDGEFLEFAEMIKCILFIKSPINTQNILNKAIQKHPMKLKPKPWHSFHHKTLFTEYEHRVLIHKSFPIYLLFIFVISEKIVYWCFCIQAKSGAESFKIQSKLSSKFPREIN